MFAYLLLPLIGALIGWITNIIALRLLFRPLHPLVIPVINYRFQGLIPRRRRELSRSIGDIIEKELLSRKDILEQVNYDAMQEELLSAAEVIIKKWTEEKLSPLIPFKIKEVIKDFVTDLVKKEIMFHLRTVMRNMIDSAWDEVKVSEIVEEKLNRLSIERVEQMIIFVASRELKHIEYLGAILGFLIGMVQALIVYLLR
ncbi:MAG: DUF445 domain-containing protein [Firmicutes bacterium HGW-Firmicutes-13]|nr:MAG: DUF445 domain-containing protein [Firmicutes bacterium HGW-Firmicutes-13]